MSELVYALPTAVAGLLCLVAFLAIARYRPRARGARALATMIFADFVWSFGSLAELYARSLEGKIAWDDVQVPPVFVSALALLAFARAYTHRSFARPRLAWTLLAAPAVATGGFILTSRWHGLARPNAHLVAARPFDSLIYDFSAIEIAGYAYCVTLLVVSVAYLYIEIGRRPKAFRAQIATVAFGCTIPLASVVFLAMGVRVLGQRDTTPLWFGLGAAFVSWALVRHRLFELVPLARDRIVEDIPDPIIVVDAADRIVEVNRATRDMFARDVSGEPLGRLLSAWDTLAVEHVEPAWRAEIEHGSPARAYELRVAALSDFEGERRGRAVVLHDVTDRRRRAALAVEASEQRFRGVFDQTLQFMGVVGLDGTLREPNRAALDLVGVRAEDVVGKPFWETPWWTHSVDLQERLKSAIEAAARGETVRFEATHEGNDGKEHFVDFSIKPALGADGRPAMLVAEGRDVTNLRRAEVEKTALEAQLFQAQKMESLGRLAGGVAHDFNNLLTVILGNASLARQTSAGKGVDDRLKEIEHAATSAAELTRQLLVFGRRQVQERRVIDLRDVTERLRPLLARLIGEDVRIDLSLCKEPAAALVDATQVEQIIVNLAVNARDAMPRGGNLRIEIARAEIDEALARSLDVTTGAYVRLTVTDDGAGMSPETRARAFEPFFTTKAPGRGTGLGLSIVFGAVRQNEGAVALESELGRGTTFRIYFPIAEAIAVEEGGAAESLPRGNERIWLVEDQPLLRSFVEGAFGRLGYSVQSFASGEQLLDAMAKSAPAALLFTDLVLPGIDGSELATRVKAAHPSIRVAFASGYSEEVVARHGGLPEGAVFVAKPFTVERLARAARTALDARERPEPRRILVVDDDEMVLTVVVELLRARGHEATTIVDGRNVAPTIERARDRGEPFDLVLVDAHLEAMTGFDVCKRLRADGCSVPMVCMSGDALDEVACKAAGFDGVLAKPIAAITLDTCVASHASRRPG